MTGRAVKPTGAQPRTVVPITTALNISALAREHGVSRKTITRRLAKGWRPEAGRPGAHSAAPTPAQPMPALPVRAKAVRVAVVSVSPAVTPLRAPVRTDARPPLGVVRTVLLLLAVAFYVFVACAAVHR